MQNFRNESKVPYLNIFTHQLNNIVIKENSLTRVYTNKQKKKVMLVDQKHDGLIILAFKKRERVQ